MKKITPFLIVAAAGLFLGSCAGINYLTVETLEPAQVILPSHVLSLAVVNNVVTQPDDIGHETQRIGRSEREKSKASSDSVAVYYTEALTQFLNEEDYFKEVLFYPEPLRSDTDFFQERPLTPAKMNDIRKKTGVDAVISLDKLLIQTVKREQFRQQGYTYGDMTGKIQSILRVYLPTLEGKIPAIQYSDSMRWEGFDIQDERAYAENMLPTREEAMKLLAVRAAEKMTYVFAPHWERQNRWYYTLSNTLMRNGEAFAKSADWVKAIEMWKAFYHNSTHKIEKAKAANNIALAYEMMDDMTQAVEWANLAYDLFVQSAGPGSPDSRRSLLYKNELERRVSTFNKLNMEGM